MMRVMFFATLGVALFLLIVNFDTLNETQEKILEVIFGFAFGGKFGQSVAEGAAAYFTNKNAGDN